MNSLLISITVLGYNAESMMNGFVNDAIEHTHREIELLRLDYDSIDASPEMVSPIRDNRIVLTRNESGSVARNKDLKADNGTFFKYLYSDDNFNEIHIARQLSKLATSSGLAMCTSA